MTDSGPGTPEEHAVSSPTWMSTPLTIRLGATGSKCATSYELLYANELRPAETHTEMLHALTSLALGQKY